MVRSKNSVSLTHGNLLAQKEKERDAAAFSSPSKVTPANTTRHDEERGRSESNQVVRSMNMFVVSLHTLLKRYGGQRHPKIESYEEFRDRGELILWKYVPPGSTIIYISHEWVGTNHPDPKGEQMYHLLLLFERLQEGDVDRTDMDVFHSLLYKHNYTTTAEEWKCMLDSQRTFIFYDGFCVPKETGASVSNGTGKDVKVVDLME